MFTMTGNVRTHNTVTTWQTRDLPARAENSTTEGADFTFNNLADATRVTNTAQIITQGVEVSGTAQAESHYGIKDLMRDQLDYRMEQWKGSAERVLIRSTQVTGDSDTVRTMGGLLSSIATVASTNSNNSLTETLYIGLQKAVWDQGTKARDCLTNGSLRIVIDTFNALGKTTWQAPSTLPEVTNMLLLYHGSFGTVRNHLSRDLNDGDGTAELVMLDFTKWSKAWLRPVHLRKIDSQADSFQTAIVGELTLKYDDEGAAGKLTALNTVSA